MFAQVFLAATNHLLAQAGWARQRLLPHAGRCARLELPPLTTIDFSISADGHLADLAGVETPDVVLRLPLGDLSLDQGLAAAMRKVRIEGNAELADALGFVFRHLRWDVEEDLSRLIGDIAAHRLIETGRQWSAGGRRALQGLGLNLGEYLVEEQPVLVGRPALADLAREIAELRDAVGRLEKRVDRLGRRR